MNPATATRQEIRDFVKANSEELLRHIELGGNPHQKSLDQKDLLDAELSSLTDEERSRFNAIYLEEMNANSYGMLDSAAKMNQQALEANIKHAQGEYSTMSWVAAFIILLITAIVFIKH